MQGCYAVRMDEPAQRGRPMKIAWGRCVICDEEVRADTIEQVEATLNLHSMRVHPEVTRVSEIDAARARWFAGKH